MRHFLLSGMLAALACCGGDNPFVDFTGDASAVAGVWITNRPTRTELTLAADGTFTFQSRLLGTTDRYEARAGTFAVNASLGTGSG